MKDTGLMGITPPFYGYNGVIQLGQNKVPVKDGNLQLGGKLLKVSEDGDIQDGGKTIAKVVNGVVTRG